MGKINMEVCACVSYDRISKICHRHGVLNVKGEDFTDKLKIKNYETPPVQKCFQ